MSMQAYFFSLHLHTRFCALGSQISRLLLQKFRHIEIVRALSRIYLLIGVIATISPAITGCASNPATGDTDLVFMSEKEELKLGREQHAKIMESMPIYPDEKLQAYINGIGQHLAAKGDRPDLTYTFTIIDSPDINAFAVPGGYIYVYRGLIGYLHSEAQIAAVIAHEIGHVTARHMVRQHAAKKGSSVGTGVATVVSVLTTGTNVGGELADLYSTAAVMGYGREMELEADRFGAEYLFRSGYDPQAMVEVISILKDQERFTRLKIKDSGKKLQTYHGVFSTHPRNDQRLREIVDEAGRLAENAQAEKNIDIFREKTEGLIFGFNFDAAKDNAPTPEPNRYTHANLGITILFPQDWNIDNQRSAIVAQPDDKTATISLTVDRLTSNIPPSEFIRTELAIPLLTQSEPFVQYGLIGHTGIKPAKSGQLPQRIAALYQGNRVYIITCSEEKSIATPDFDEMCLKSIKSFQPTRVINLSSLKSQQIHYVRANGNTTFAALAKLSPLKRYAEEELRLLNNYYPNGEPKAGEWIKIIK